MSKTFKTMCLLFALIFITVGCGTEKTQEVANYDEAYHVEQRDHYRSLHRYLSDEYENDLDDMKKDPLFPEYVRLNGIYGVGQAREWDNFKGTVHLDQQTIQYGEQVINYQEIEDTVVLSQNPTELMDETLERMVRLAQQQEADDQEHNTKRLLPRNLFY